MFLYLYGLGYEGKKGVKKKTMEIACIRNFPTSLRNLENVDLLTRLFDFSDEFLVQMGKKSLSFFSGLNY